MHHGDVRYVTQKSNVSSLSLIFTAQPYFRTKLNPDYSKEANDGRRERALAALRAKKAAEKANNQIS